ncbi:hypothetical protein JXJ21_20045 [candidate division KSB1 bacterium]|nr:hypothetical protein [candidate division KSB1 bacterium]
MSPSKYLYFKGCFLFALLHAIAALTITCRLKSPQPPSWQPQVTIPLIDKSYTISELVNNDKLGTDSSGTLEYITDHDIPRQEVGDRIKFGPIQKNRDLAINAIHIPILFSDWLEFSLDRIYPLADEEHGEELVVDPFEIYPNSQDFTEIPSFRWLKISKGILSVKIKNELVISLGVPFRVKLINSADNTIIGEVTFNEKIKAGASAERKIQLPQTVLTNHIRAIVSGASAGSEGQLKKIDKNSTCKILVTFTDIIATELMAKIPEYHFTYQDTIRMSDSLLIREGIVKRGAFEYSLRNNFDVLVYVTLELPNVFKPDGLTFVDTLEIIPGQTLYRKIQLEQYMFKAFEKQEIENLHLNWNVRLATNINNTVTIRSLDAVVSSMKFSKIIFSSFTGRLYRIPFPIPQTTKNLDLPSEIDSVRLAGAYLTFQFEYSIILQTVIN